MSGELRGTALHKRLPSPSRTRRWGTGTAQRSQGVKAGRPKRSSINLENAIDGFRHPIAGTGEVFETAPRTFAARNLKNIQRWMALAHGGHFVAMEPPQRMAEDKRAFFRQRR